MDFCSTQKGKLKWRGYRNGKVVKTKNFSRILATAYDIRNPYPELKEVMMSIEAEFNKNYIECYGTDRSPILMMFPSKYAETRTASKFFDDISDFRLRRWMDFLGDNADWNDITDELLMDYVGYLETEDIAKAVGADVVPERYTVVALGRMFPSAIDAEDFTPLDTDRVRELFALIRDIES